MMAKLNISVDTEEQTISVDVDGTGVNKVNEISVMNWGVEDDPRFYFTVSTYEKVGNVYKTTKLMAKESEPARELVKANKAKASEYEGFVEVIDTKDAVHNAIYSLFKSSRCK